ncbi:PP2C family protein-serine/threonine phosphatase [Nocardioides limicola]|uniref:PP2C family protein-serine/threonine phosphatase n=1 Tax=Nocardioides limicola TaxID=2803368 RepID=UPI00193AE2E1|nr:protein phosphatase 2C domain-containing protein [Nocardioides sp. DJM-14]
MVTTCFGAGTDVGCVREVNEDSFLVDASVFAVADGMGGHHGGDLASRIAVTEVAALAGRHHGAEEATHAIVAALSAAHRRIQALGRDDGGWYAGTTVVAAILVGSGDGARWLLANVGDSRGYRFTADGLEQVTVDHSVVQELVDSGALTPEATRTHPERHVVTRALGGPVECEPDFFSIPVEAAPRLLLCSDGISAMIDDSEIAAILAASPDPRDAADRLVAAALAAGGKDNATAVVVDVMGLTEDEATYDADTTRTTLHQKLGAE